MEQPSLMSEELLESKIHIPILQPGLVSRPRLLRQLEDGLSSGRRLTLLSAPAGFGKTTLLAEWAASLAQSRPTAWITLEESENDAVLFLRYWMEAMRRNVEGTGQTVLHLLQSPQPAAPQALLVSLLNDLASTPSFLLVLDDFHLIRSESIPSMLEFVLDHAPPTMHVAIGTREDPPLPLARYRVRGQITELREADLRFNAGEAEEFLCRCMHLPLSAPSVQALETRTEGWAAGLQLAAFALQKESGSPEDFITAFSGDNRFVMDYLVAEVLNRLPEDTREFLQRTSILDRLYAPLCDAVAARSGSQAVLEQLEASNIFLIPLDSRREWFRYHRLFAGFLQARLNPQEEAALQERAAAWFESRGMFSQAVRHALAAGALTGRYTDAVRLISLIAEEEIREGRVQTLLGWLNAIPEKRIRSEAELSVYKGWALSLSGDFDGAAEYAAFVLGAQTGAAENPLVRGKALLLQAFITLLWRKDQMETIRLADLAICAFGDQPTQWLPMAYWMVAEANERMGNVEEAIRTLRKGKQVMPASLSRLFAVLVDMMLIYDLNLGGRRREALALANESLRVQEESRPGSSPTVRMMLGHLAYLHYEANQLEEALRIYDRFGESGTASQADPYLSFSRAMNSPLLFALGRVEDALEVLAQAVSSARQTGLSDLGSLLAAEALLHLRSGDLAFASHWAREAGCSVTEDIEYLRVDSLLVYARLLLAERNSGEAGRLLERLHAFLEKAGMRRPLIPVCILQALQADQVGDRIAVEEHLRQALREASPEEYLRAFLDEDERVLALLPAVRSESPAFVDRLLAAASGLPAPTAVHPAALAEPLSDREREILQRIADGLSNAEIAARLVIAPATVKRHINNIFGKLGVNSRTQAVAKARRLNLLR